MSSPDQDLIHKWKIAVIKFSGSPTAKPEEINQVIHDINAWLHSGYRVLAVASAIEDTLQNPTYNALLDASGYTPPLNEFTEYLATGEDALACIVAMRLDWLGIKSKKLSHQCLLTKEAVLNSEPASLTTDLILSLFERYSVLVLPGAVGHDEANRTTVLGRNGADYTAIFAALSLHAEDCILYKNIDELYESNLHGVDATSRRYESICYDDLLKLPTPIIHHKALKFAESKQVNFNIKSLIIGETIRIGPQPTAFCNAKQLAATSKVDLVVPKSTFQRELEEISLS